MKVIIKFLLLMLFSVNCLAALGMGAIPHVGQKAQDSFQFDYAYANDNRAFAIAPGEHGRGALIKPQKKKPVSQRWMPVPGTVSRNVFSMR